LIGTAALLGMAPGALAAHGAAEPRRLSGDRIEPDAGGWKTWVLSSGRQLQIAPPPDQATTTHEIAQLHALAAQRDAAALNRISYWDAVRRGIAGMS
jgi:hypothetical protein